MKMLLSVLCLAVAFAGVALASSHSEAPGTTRVKAADLTDLYVFRSYETGRDTFTTFIMNVNPLQAPAGGPNFYAMSTEHLYYLHLDGNGDGTEDVSFEFLFSHQLGGANTTVVQVAANPCGIGLTFQNVFAPGGVNFPVNTTSTAIPLKYFGAVTAADPLSKVNFIQTYSLSRIVGLVPNGTTITRQAVTDTVSNSNVFGVPADYAGPKTFPDYATYANTFIRSINIPGCATPGKVFVGQRRESFAVNLGAIFDLINMVPVAGQTGSIADNDQNNALLGYNIGTIAMEIPNVCLPSTSSTVNVWATTRYLLEPNCPPTCPGPHLAGSQYSRLGNPLVNEVVIGLRDKNLFNTFPPTNDVANLAQYVFYPTLPEIIQSLFAQPLTGNANTRISPTNFPRYDLVQAFLVGFDSVNRIIGGSIYEAIRYNFSIAATPAASQNPLGVIGGDNAGFPNGRRPGDDVVDIALDVMMGRLCHLGVVSFGSGCRPADAPTGLLTFLDGAPQRASQFGTTFPYLNTPLPGFASNVVVPTTTSSTSSRSSSAAAEVSADAF